MLPSLLALLLTQASAPIAVSLPELSRFQYEAPLTSIPGVKLDDYEDGMGLAQQMARAHNLQARIMWIDGTANLGRVNSEDKIESLCAQIAKVGFNTIVFDIKPISGQVLYKSTIEPKILSWRGQDLPADFDPLPIMIREAHKNGLTLLVSMNAFSEGHSLFKVGPGYGMPEHQSVLYEATPVLRAPDGETADIDTNLKTLPKGDDLIHVFSTGAKPGDVGTCYWVGVSRDGMPVSFGKGGTPSTPKTGGLYVASGTAGDFLNRHALDRLKIDCRATFVRTGIKPEQYPLMMNPNDPIVQSRELSIMQEVVSNYPVDGVLYDDRLRFAGMDADFSPLSETLFERYLGAKVNWPDDVYKVTFTQDLHKGIKPGKYYDAWMLWRALQIRNWVARVRDTVKTIRPNALFGIYGGSWYGDYPALGSNYGAPGLEAGFWFLTPKYARTGFADLLDILITGCYYDTATIYQAMEEGKSVGATIEAAGQLSNRVADDQCWTVAGISLESYDGDPDGLERALQAACGSTQGVMCFDLSHNIEEKWPVFASAFRFPATPPYAKKGELAKVRALRARYRELGAKERPVVISAGGSGTGF